MKKILMSIITFVIIFSVTMAMSDISKDKITDEMQRKIHIGMTIYDFDSVTKGVKPYSEMQSDMKFGDENMNSVYKQYYTDDGSVGYTFINNRLDSKINLDI